MLYSVLKAFGIKVEVLPVIIDHDIYRDFRSKDSDYDDGYYTYEKPDGKVHVGLSLAPHFSAQNHEYGPLSKVSLFDHFCSNSMAFNTRLRHGGAATCLSTPSSIPLKIHLYYPYVIHERSVSDKH